MMGKREVGFVKRKGIWKTGKKGEEGKAKMIEFRGTCVTIPQDEHNYVLKTSTNKKQRKFLDLIVRVSQRTDLTNRQYSPI